MSIKLPLNDEEIAKIKAMSLQLQQAFDLLGKAISLNFGRIKLPGHVLDPSQRDILEKLILLEKRKERYERRYARRNKSK